MHKLWKFHSFLLIFLFIPFPKRVSGEDVSAHFIELTIRLFIDMRENIDSQPEYLQPKDISFYQLKNLEELS